jgi:hypothetical protein
MLVDYKPTDMADPKFMARGVILNSCCDLFDLDRNPEWDRYPTFTDRDSSGVCDSLDNLLEVFPELSYTGEGHRKFVVNMVCIDQDDELEFDGWRWGHWGEYIGKETPTTEYLYDDPNIERVYCFRIYEKLTKYK